MDYFSGDSPANLLKFSANVKVWIIKIGFNQSLVLGNNYNLQQERKMRY